MWHQGGRATFLPVDLAQPTHHANITSCGPQKQRPLDQGADPV